MRRNQHISLKTKHSHGMVLFIALIMLLSLTIIGLSAMNNSFIELKTAANVQEMDIAYQSAQAGLDAVMCLTNKERSGTKDDNPLDNKYKVITKAEEEPILQFEWDKTYDVENVSPFEGVTRITCSVDDGKLEIGSTGSINNNDDLAVAVRRLENGKNPRTEKGTSYGILECQNFIIDSRYDYPTSGANATVLAKICRQKPKS